MDEGERREAEYVPPFSLMQNAIWVVAFVAYVLLAYTWASHQVFNTWFALGGWVWLGAFLMFKYGPIVIENRSPKGICNRVGTTVATAEPVATIPANGIYPELGIWPARTLRWGIITFLTARAYIICPTVMAYRVGQGKQGVNVLWNAHLQFFSDHRELPPHVYQALKHLGRLYKPEIPVFFNIFPLMIHELTPEQLEEYTTRFENIGISRQKFKEIRPILEQCAATLTVFKYTPGLTKFDETLDQALRVANADNAKLRALVETWSDYGDRMTRKFLRPELPPSPSALEKFGRATTPASEEDELPQGR